MARALLGHVGTHNEQALVTEVMRLRRRVAELESQLTDLRAAHSAALEDSHLDLELHRLTGESQPALA